MPWAIYFGLIFGAIQPQLMRGLCCDRHAVPKHANRLTGCAGRRLVVHRGIGVVALL